jgi:hypothetical protein
VGRMGENCPTRGFLLFQIFLYFTFFHLFEFLFQFQLESTLNSKHNFIVVINPIFIFIIIIIIIVVYLPSHTLIQKGIKDYHNYLSQILYYIYVYIFM